MFEGDRELFEFVRGLHCRMFRRDSARIDTVRSRMDIWEIHQALNFADQLSRGGPADRLKLPVD